MAHKIYKNVQLGKNVHIEDGVEIGVPPRGREDGELATVIGDDAVLRSHSVIYAGNQIGRGLQTGHHVLIREENEIGDDVSIGSGSIVEHHVVLKDRVRIHSMAFIPEFTWIDEDAWLGPHVVITNARYPMSINVKNELVGARIHRGAKVGANSTLLPGVVLGRDCLVGAGAVVTKNVEPLKVVAGNPARTINEVQNLPYAVTSTQESHD